MHFGGYLSHRELGRGGSATVYQAHRPSEPHRMVALKVLDEDHRTPSAQNRLRREFEFARQLDHPHIVRVYEHGRYWLAMQLAGGGNAMRLRDTDRVLPAVAQIAGALDCAHRHGIVHCDVKPANILVAENFSHAGAVLVDFGAAHAVAEDVRRRPGRPQVSLPYTAPEVLLGQPPSAATDEYALACTAVELLTGTPPFVADSAAELVSAQLRRMPPRLSRDFGWASRAIDAVLARALAKSPELRYRSCTEFAEHLTRALRPPD